MKQRKNNYLENAIHFEEALHAWASEYLEVEKRWWGARKRDQDGYVNAPGRKMFLDLSKWRDNRMC